MNNHKKTYIFDTSAILTYLEDEDGADYVEDLLTEAEVGNSTILISFISLTEIFYITAREKGESVAQKRVELIQSLAVEIEESNNTINVAAGKLKANHRISLADAFIGALAEIRNGMLVHKDPEFENLAEIVKECRLPYKRSSGV